MAEHVSVARPAHALVSLRAVCGNVDKIALLGPGYILDKTVQKPVAAGEAAVKVPDGRVLEAFHFL